MPDKRAYSIMLTNWVPAIGFSAGAIGYWQELGAADTIALPVLRAVLCSFLAIVCWLSGIALIRQSLKRSS